MNTRITKRSAMTVLEVLENEGNKQVVNFPYTNIADLSTDYHGPSPCHLNYCGVEHCPPGFQFGPSIRRSYLLHSIMDGHGIYKVHNKTYELSKGDMFLIYPGDVTIYRADQKDPWSYFWIGFNGYQAAYILSQMGFSPLQHVIHLDDLAPMADCVMQMLGTHQLTLANELLRESLLLRFFSLAIRQLPARSTKPVHASAEYAKVTMQYLTNHYMDKIRISDIANYVGVDRSYLTKSFHAEYQISPQEYLINLRMCKAAELLRHSDQSVSMIAQQCGYPDALAFTKMFRQHYRKSPTEYRQEAEKQHEND
ncbi:MAG: helix-turn-helix domain-containing protein [Blautia sp.]|nr:helix-turn-helix domain-containing protein [Blautia sp.]